MSDGSFDLSSASAAALAHLQAPAGDTTNTSSSPTPSDTSATPASAGQVAAPSSGQATTGATSTPETAGQPQPPAKTWKVKVDGQDVEISNEQELLNGYSRTATWTQRMQRLAQERTEFEQAQQAQLQREQAQAQREAEWDARMRDPQLVQRYLAFLTGGQQQPPQSQQPQFQPDALATIGAAQQLAEQRALALQQQLQRQIAETQRWTTEQIARGQAEAQQRQQALAYQGQINDTINAVLGEHPVLKGVEDIADLLQRDAQSLRPTSIGEALEALKNVASARAEKLTATFTEMQKQAAVQRTQLQTNGIEPPGGAAPAPPPIKAKLGDKSLTVGAIAYMESINAQRK